MLFDNKVMRLDCYVPETHLEVVKEALFQAGAGKIGNYDKCCWQTLGQGQFRPLSGSSPFIGKKLIVEQVSEYKIEIIFPASIKGAVVEALRKSHPYEEPAFQIFEVKLEQERMN